MAIKAEETVEVLRVHLHGVTVGYLIGYQHGRNIFVFDDDYAVSSNRPTFTLTTHPNHPNAKKTLENPWITNQQLHPVFSNLLPEGALREWFAQMLKIHINTEFPLFHHLVNDLPGAIMAKGMEPDEIPKGLLEHGTNIKPVTTATGRDKIHFSLAGVQMKFSMHQSDGRYITSQPDQLGEWIIKTPSTVHNYVPLNEYTAMQLAGLAGIDIPEIRLVKVSDLTDLPDIKLPDEEFAYAIRRFDRGAKQERIHTEDFAQVLFKYAHDKYRSSNYEQIGRIMNQYTGNSLANTQQLARRILVNILLANGDAHLKNWSLIYPDTITAELAPAYDIVTTKAYIKEEKEFALNFNGTKNWYDLTMNHFEAWSNTVDVPWRAIKAQLDDTLDKARTQWPQALTESPMIDAHKQILRTHWKALHSDFRIDI